jgi:hypothetical protein
MITHINQVQLNPPSSYHLANSWNTIHPHSCQKTVKNKSYTELELIQNLKQILTLNSVDKGTEKPKSLDLKPMQV